MWCCAQFRSSARYVEGVEKTSYQTCDLEMIYRVKRMMRIIRDKLTHNVVLPKYSDDLKVIISLLAKVL